MATKKVCDICGDDCEFGSGIYLLKYNISRCDGVIFDEVRDEQSEKDLCGYCASQFRRFLVEAPARVAPVSEVTPDER